MGGLRPEKRLDKNGRLVTKHVRDGEAAARPGHAIPAPSLGKAEAEPGPRAKKFKPRPKQVQQRRFSLRAPWHATVASRKLWIEGRTGLNWRLDATRLRPIDFDASDVEAYAVLSAVARPVDALHLLAAGHRDAESARGFVLSRDAGDLLLDRTALCSAALERGIPFEDFFENHAAFDRTDRSPTDIAGAIAFSSSTALRVADPEGTVAVAIADGEVSFDDIKRVGSGRLQDPDVLQPMLPIFRAMRSGDCDWTAKGVAEVLDSPRREGQRYWLHHDALAEFMAHAPMEDVLAAPRIQPLIDAYRQLARSGGARHEPSDAASLALYASALGILRHWGNVDQPWDELAGFRDAGLPAGLAAEVLAAGGTLEQAIAVHAGEVEAGLTSGYL